MKLDYLDFNEKYILFYVQWRQRVYSYRNFINSKMWFI